jgi:enoyl-[acyl-carrier protein] reductase II
VTDISDIKQMMARGCEFLGTEYAILGGAMSWISERNLVSAISNAGGFGVIACGAMEPHMLDEEIAETAKRTDKPFGVNLITMHPQLDELIQVCAKHEVSHVVLAGGLPPGWAIPKIKEFGAKLICFAPAFALARKLHRSGVDALVIEGMEAGSHPGSKSARSAFSSARVLSVRASASRMRISKKPLCAPRPAMRLSAHRLTTACR